jgi:cadmium resistance protein CadD (predicted permease)
VLSTILVCVLAFISTNIDDLFVLLAFFSDPTIKRRDVILGQYIGICALVAISIACSLVAIVIPHPYLGLLGLLPIAIGVKKLWSIRQNKNRDREDKASIHPSSHNIAAITAVTIANGGDNIAVYVPLLVTQTARQILVLTAVFAAMTAIWCLAALYLANHPSLGRPIRRYGATLLPWILIALGLGILWKNHTITLFA